MRIAASILAIIIAVSMPCFAGDWPSFRKDAGHSADSGTLLQPPLKLKWEYPVSGKIIASPSVSQGRVYVGARDNTLYCLDAKTGGLLWKFVTKGWVDSSAAVVDNAVYVASRDGNLYCLGAEHGEMLWKYVTGGTDSASPLVAEGKVFCASGFPNTFVYALDAKTGKELWRRETQQMVYSSPALLENNLYIGSNDGYVYCLDKESGNVVWKYQTQGGIYMASPALRDYRLYIAAGDFDWTVYALKPDSGNEWWKHEIADKKPTPNYVSSIAVGNGVIFVAAGYEQQFLYCLDAANGMLKWKGSLGPAARFGFSSSACVTEDIVYVAAANGILKAFEIMTGALKWQYSLGSGVLSSPCVAGNILYVATLKGTIYAFE
jgi:outer membrane protein assembly factor BamB